MKILQLFSRGKKFTTGQLQRRFNDRISIRVIQRDLKELEAAGIRFIQEKGLGNEKTWSIDKKFRTDLRLALGKDEYFSALFLKDALKVLKGTAIEEASQKLSQQLDSLLPDQLLDEIGEFKETTIFENVERGAYDYSGYSDVIEDIIHAILTHKICTVRYFHGSTSVESAYHVEPRKIIQYDGALYVAVYRRKEEKFSPLAIHRIKELQVSTEVFLRTPEYDSARFRSGRFGIFGSDNLEQIELKFDTGIVYHIENRIWDESQEVGYDAEGNLILKMEIGITPELVSWILGWGKYCEVFNPPQFKENHNTYY